MNQQIHTYMFSIIIRHQ